MEQNENGSFIERDIFLFFMKRELVIDLTSDHEEAVENLISVKIDSPSHFVEWFIPGRFRFTNFTMEGYWQWLCFIAVQPVKRQCIQQQQEDYELAKSLQVGNTVFDKEQISEYIHSLREQSVEAKKQTPISLYYKRTVEEPGGNDVEIISSDLKGLEKKCNTKSKSKLKKEEEEKLTTLNVFQFDMVSHS